MPMVRVGMRKGAISGPAIGATTSHFGDPAMNRSVKMIRFASLDP